MALNIQWITPFFGFMKNKPLTKNKKKQPSHLITEGYGTPQEFAKALDLGVEMLFYIEEEVFTQREVRGWSPPYGALL